MSDKKPNLGLATTKELIDELAARADVAATVKEDWPSYKTVSEEPVCWPKMNAQLLELGYRWDCIDDARSFVVVDNGNGHEWAEVGR